MANAIANASGSVTQFSIDPNSTADILLITNQSDKDSVSLQMIYQLSGQAAGDHSGVGTLCPGADPPTLSAKEESNPGLANATAKKSSQVKLTAAEIMKKHPLKMINIDRLMDSANSIYSSEINTARNQGVEEPNTNEEAMKDGSEEMENSKA